MNIEPLELRIAPASAFVTYTDIDGDVVKITARLPGAAVPPLDLADLTIAAGQLQLLNLTDPGFADAHIIFSVVKKTGGDGLANVGRITATGVSLGTVIVKGDLGDIDAGDGTDTAIKSLTMRSAGLHGLLTQGAGNLKWDIQGAVGSIAVAGDIRDATILISGALGSLTIGGSLIGGSAFGSGFTSIQGDVGPIKIRGNIDGGSADESGKIVTRGAMTSLSVGGSVLGTTGDYNSDFVNTGIGQVVSFGNMGPVRIGGNVQGGSGNASGGIAADGTLARISIGGSLTAGTGNFSGAISVSGDTVRSGSEEIWRAARETAPA